jgi:3-deoxy-7-phosphoheptulonate synthase
VTGCRRFAFSMAGQRIEDVRIRATRPLVTPAVAADLAARMAAGERAIWGVMLESNLLGGAQDYRVRPFVYGRSITDPCLSFEKTVPVLARLAEAVRSRRART